MRFTIIFWLWRCVKLGKVLVTAAWPYINHVPHLGNLLPILSADVIARYYRLKGDEVLFVSGSDEHGTPIEIEAIRQNISPKELTDRNHEIVSMLFRKWAISFDNYTRTESPVHKEFVRNLMLKIERNGYIFTREDELPFCPKCQRFLPDRFVEGKCPYCGYERARGDQCEQCGRLLDPAKLEEPRCAICGASPTMRTVKHWYFDMPKFEDMLLAYIEGNRQLSDNARNFSLNLLKEGLKPRPITRDNKWGIPAPFKEAGDKTIYVWFDAVLGYVSATIEYFKMHSRSERWKDYWFNKDSKTLYFIGKDNIPFHTLIFPALLMATHEDYNLPWNVCTNEWLIFAGQKSSKSRRIGVWIDEALEMFPVDYWRYTLISIRPETKDSDFTWKIFIEKVNSDLNDTLGNFIHRTLKFINTYFNSEVPKPMDLDELDKSVLNAIEEKVKSVNDALSNFQLQLALRESVELSRIGNRYFNEKKPWETIKADLRVTSNTLYVSAQIVKALSILLEPFIPITAEKIRDLLNLPEKISWDDAVKSLQAGHRIKNAEPIFSKIEVSEDELQENLEKVRSGSEKISMEDFSRLDLRVGKIIKVESVPKSQNLLKLTIDVGGGNLKTAVAGIAKYYRADDLEGRHIVVVTNLKPRRIFGIESEVMILAAQNGEKVVFIQPEKPISPGSKVS
ncbi:MAG: methionine--tRNA ligase [Candidatus Bathyarchaeia archaeon]|nr:methionine--tRNA ligase [Candidatus Bathyarchaeota archaeon]